VTHFNFTLCLVSAGVAFACGAPADEFVAVSVQFASPEVSTHAEKVSVAVYELGSDDAVNPCIELLGGGDAESIGLSIEESESAAITDPPISIIFGLHLTVGTKAFYSEATGSSGNAFVRACRTGSPNHGDQIDLLLR